MDSRELTYIVNSGFAENGDDLRARHAEPHIADATPGTIVSFALPLCLAAL